jgi:general secretion pathway protein K
MLAPAKPQKSPQRGIVIVAVLWMVAALSIIVTGVVNAVRKDVRLTTVARQTLSAGAKGDAAIHVALQRVKAKPTQNSQLTYMDVAYGGETIRVELQPLNGLIDINGAPKELLSMLFVVAAGLDRAASDNLAQAVIDARQVKDARGLPLGFEAIEDLLAVPGIEYSSYAKIKKLVTADVRGAGRVNPMAAPLAVLIVLAEGDVNRATQIAYGRDAGAVGVDTTTLNAGFIDGSQTQRVKLQARVELPDGVTVLNSRSVDLGSGAQDGLPWRTFRADRFAERKTGPGKAL